MCMNKLKEFFKCELKFFANLLLGLTILNIFAYILNNVIEQAFSISWLVSAIVIILNIIYFFYQLIRILYGYKYVCKNISHRVSGWLSSIIGE